MLVSGETTGLSFDKAHSLAGQWLETKAIQLASCSTFFCIILGIEESNGRVWSEPHPQSLQLTLSSDKVVVDDVWYCCRALNRECNVVPSH